MYTHGHHERVWRAHRWRTVETSAAYLLERLRPGLRLLDVGCGPGTITLDLAAHVAPGEVIGIDASAEVIEEARAAAAAAGGSGSLDVVHVHQVLHHVPDPVGALRALRRVCRPGGVVAVRETDYHAMTWAPANPALDRWMALFQAVARGNGGEPDAGRLLYGWALDAGYAEVQP